MTIDIQEQRTNGDTKQVAGIIVVREQPDGTYRVLSLLPGAEVEGKSGKTFYRFYGTYDIPKGHGKGGEPAMIIALREAEEEAGYNESNLDFRWGKKSVSVNGRKGKKGTFFVAHSDVDPVIARNPENGMLEHGGFKWVTFDEMESKVGRFWFGDAISWARDIVESGAESNESQLRGLIIQVLSEADPRTSKSKRVLYHINKNRPAMPQPKVNYLEEWDPKAFDPDTGKRTGNIVKVPGTDVWTRHWLKQPVKSGVFLTTNPVDIAMNHGRMGDVYAYRVPEWVIAKSGGLHRYDWGTEILIPEEVWNDAGVKGGAPYGRSGEIEFLGKSMTRDQLREKIDSSGDYGRGQTRKSKKPSWLSPEELEAWEARKKEFKLAGLRASKHPRDVIKMLKPDEVKAALAAFEKWYEVPKATWRHDPGDRKGWLDVPVGKKVTEEDRELIDMLRKRLEESALRNRIRQMLLEEARDEPNMAKYVDDLEDEIFRFLFQRNTYDYLQDQSVNAESTVTLKTSLFDEHDNINEVHLGVSVNDSLEANVDAAYICVPNERSTSNLVLTLDIPRNYPEVDGFQDWLSAELADALSHEIQHSCDTSEMLGSDIPEGEAKWESLENIEKYYASDAETRGHVAGILGRARRTGADPDDLLDRDMSTIMSKAVERGYSQEELVPVIQRIYGKWSSRLASLS